VEASPRFKSDVLRAIRARRRPRIAWRLMAATAMMFLLVAGTYGLSLHRQRQRVREVRAQLPRLRSELHRVKAIADEVQPVAVFENGDTRVIVTSQRSQPVYY
jgi:type II secretory pathway component PulM